MRTLLLILGYLIADSALTDPCEHHTVLEDTWRSTDCIETQCTGQWKCDEHLAQGWYRFKSSGGWEIPETPVPDHRCSTQGPGWLKDSHPTVGEGEVERTVCFTWKGDPCTWTPEIKIKNCTSYFVYELKPTPRCNMSYCTDPKKVPNQEPEEQSTRKFADRSSSSPAVSASTETSPTQEPEKKSTHQSDDRTSTIPVVSTASGPETSPTQEPKEQSTLESAEHSSSLPAGSATSDPETSPAEEPEEQSTRESSDRTSSFTAVSAASDQETNPTQEPEKQTSQESTEKSSSIPAGSTASDSGKTTRPGAKGESTSEAECKPSEAGHSRPGVLELSEEECEKVSAEVQVMYIGKKELETPAEKEAYLRQVQDMLKDHLPCKKLALQFHGEDADGAEKKKGK